MGKSKHFSEIKKTLTKSVTLSIVVFLLNAGIAMGAMAFLQFTDWDVAFYIFASIPLPMSVAFLISKILYPALNKSKRDDKNVTILSFICYYFSIIIGWALIWMIIWHVKPDSYHNIDTFNPKDAFNVFGYVLTGATFVSFRTAPSFVLPSALISSLVSEVQIIMAWIIELFFFGFIMKIIFKHFKVGEKPSGN